jgi:hypothetical protein
MISVFITSKGYYIKGDKIEVALSCSPKLNDSGEPLYDEQYNIYAVLAKALTNLRQQKLTEDIMVYNDTRMIDEMNGMLQPLNDISMSFRDTIRRIILPNINANVFFRKKSEAVLVQQVESARRNLIEVPNKLKIINKLIASKEQTYKNRSIRALKTLKKRWKHGKRNEQ